MTKYIDESLIYALFDRTGFARLHVSDIDTLPRLVLDDNFAIITHEDQMMLDRIKATEERWNKFLNLPDTRGDGKNSDETP